MKSEQKMNQALTSRLYEYQYQFDAAGNRTQMKYFDGSTTTTTSYTHNDGNQLTMRTEGAGYHYFMYDANGNMTEELDNKTDPIREFTWNRDDRLIAANRDDYGSASYVYDALGRRLVRTAGTTSTFYYYDGLTVIAEKQKVGEGNWDWQRVFTVAPGVIGNIFRISEKSGESWTDAYYHYDAIGNVVLRTNFSGGVLESLDQEAYGNVKVGSQSGYHLTTKEYDSIPELYYFWQRWYDPINSQFIKISPYPSNLEHQYGFTKNNPLIYIDPYGLVPTDIKDLLEWWLTLYSQGSSLKNNSAIKCRNMARCLRHKWASGITVTCMDIEVFCKCMFDSVTTSGWFGTLPLYTLESQCSWVADQVLHNGKPICQGGIRY